MRNLQKDRIAATECSRLMALLATSNAPGSRDLARIVAARMLAVLEDGAGETYDTQALIAWSNLARAAVII